MAAARANLLEVLTPEAYARLERLGARMAAGCNAVLQQRGLAGYALSVGARGCVTFSPVPIRDYAALRAHQDADLLRLTWLNAVNRGLYVTPARPEQWTLSISHTDEDADHYVHAFAELADRLAGS